MRTNLCALRALIGVTSILAAWMSNGCEADASGWGKIPSKVWEGGAGKLTIEAEATCPAPKPDKNGKIPEKVCHAYVQTRFLPSFEAGPRTRPRAEAFERITEGRHTWTIDVPADTHAFLTVGIHPAEVGSALKLTVKVNGRTIVEKAESLDQPLPPDDTFFLGVEFADVAAGKIDG